MPARADTLRVRPALLATSVQKRRAAALLFYLIYSRVLFPQTGDIIFIEPFFAIAAAAADISRKGHCRKHCGSHRNILISVPYWVAPDFQYHIAAAFRTLLGILHRILP